MVLGGAIKYLLSPITRLLRALAREKRFSAFYSQSNSLADNISLTLELKKKRLTQFGDVSPCDVII